MTKPVLFDYWKSSASYRVRIALNLLGEAYEVRAVDLLAGAQRSDTYLKSHPQGLVPALMVDGQTLTQSLAIIEYLHATRPGSGLLPEDPMGQARVRQISYAIAMDIHPICNLSVANHVVTLCDGRDVARVAWMRHFISKGLSGVEGLLAQGAPMGFCAADTPTMADCCLIPQLYNADRWGADYSGQANICRIAAHAADHPAFRAAHPDQIGPPTAG
ncbi:MAG: maleylacetoacetate isomerase [Pelagimonas sp.]|jgi:maleylacetoacetate isomerase|nr:maleylacetoacetate isomerase [Pelagimonas sp.]